MVWWASAEDLDVLAGYVAALAVHLGLPDSAGWTTVVNKLRRERLRWLLILDNVEDLDLVGPFRPSDHLGKLVITSRRRGLDGFGTELAVPDMQRHEAINLLTRRMKEITVTQAGRIAELLGYLPLAIEQSAGYLNKTQIPPDEYIQLLTNHLGDMLERGRVADRPNITIANLWKISLSRLRIERPTSAALLEMCALCAPEPIPLDLMNDQKGVVQDTILKEVAGDELAWAETVGTLVDYSLIRRDGPTIAVHRLTSAAVEAEMTAEQRNVTKTALLRILNADLPTDIEWHPEHWPRWRSLIPHLRAILDNHDDDTWDEQIIPVVAWLCDRAGGFLLQQGQPDAAIRYIDRGLSLVESRLSPSHPLALNSNNHLAQAYASAGHANQAIGIYETTLIRFAPIFDPDDTDILTVRANLADAYRSAGRVDEAIAIYERVIPTLSRFLGDTHPSTLAARNNLGCAYTTAGRSSQAISMFKQNIKDCLDTLGPDHQSTMAAHGNLADAYLMAKNPDQAISLLEQTLTANRRVLGDDHPHTLTTRARIAEAYEKKGESDEAISLYEQIYSDSLRVLGRDHPETLTFRSNLALAHGRVNQIDNSIELFEQILADRLRLFGPNHPDTEISQKNLAAAKRARGV